MAPAPTIHGKDFIIETPNPPLAPLVAVVTGASSGIGEATARRLHREPGASLVLVGRREERLSVLAASLGEERVSWVAVDLVNEEAPARIREHVIERHGRLDLLVNNAGASWRARFADGGYENIRRTMAINFDAQVRLTEALLELLRASAPSAIVNVASTAARVARAGTGAYSASKFALAGWSDSLWAEERTNGVHVGLVLPGFISTEGFPQSELTDKPWTRWIVSTPDKAAEAIYQAGVGRRPERYVPRPYALAAALRIVTPGLVRRALSGSAAAVMTTTTGADLAERASAQPEESQMIITTMNDLPGYEIEEVFGEVFGLTVRARNVGSQLGAMFKSLVGGELKGMTKMLAQGRSHAQERLVEEAEAKGANAIIAFRFDTSELGTTWTEICAYGTAVRATKR